nr:hypothetical protein [Armatimonas sp.]
MKMRSSALIVAAGLLALAGCGKQTSQPLEVVETSVVSPLLIDRNAFSWWE